MVVIQDTPEELELRKGIWLSEQPAERQRYLLKKYLFDENRAHLVVLIGPNSDEIMRTDVVFGGNEQDNWEHARKIAHEGLPVLLRRIEYYYLNGKLNAEHLAEGYRASGPLKHSF